MLFRTVTILVKHHFLAAFFPTGSICLWLCFYSTTRDLKTAVCTTWITVRFDRSLIPTGSPHLLLLGQLRRPIPPFQLHLLCLE